MTDSPNGSQPALAPTQPTAGQLVSRVAQVIMHANTMADVTPDSVRQRLGIDLTREGGEDSAGAQLTPDWHYLLCLTPQAIGGPLLYFEFYPTDPDAHPALTPICEIDLDQFAAMLQGAGFDRTPWIGEHGRRMGHYFQRGTLRVTVATQGEAAAPPEKVTHDCIRGIRVQ